jgi:hypothetical protein
MANADFHVVRRHQKVGSQFRKGKNEVLSAAEELRGILGDSAYVFHDLFHRSIRNWQSQDCGANCGQM